MNHARHTKLPPYDWDCIVLRAHWKFTPEIEIVRLAAVIESQGYARVEKDGSALHRGHLHRDQVAVKHQHGKRKNVVHCRASSSSVIAQCKESLVQCLRRSERRFS